MSYSSSTPRVVEIRSRYLNDASDQVADDVLRAMDDMLATLSTLPEDEARRMIGLVRELMDVVEANIGSAHD